MFVCKLYQGILRPAAIKLNQQAIHSALYIPGDKAHETFAVLRPHLDFNERIKNKAELTKNLKLRQLSVDLDEVENVWKFYKTVSYKKAMLEQSKETIALKIKSLSKSGDVDKDEIEKLKTHGRLVKDDIRVMKEHFWSVEEKAVLKVLAIPNVLHENTPEEESLTIFEYDVKPNSLSECNTVIGNDLNTLEYLSPDCYYLMDEAALFELSSTHMIAERLLDAGFIQTSNSDFARSAVMEGCGLPYDSSDHVFTIQEPDLEQKHENSRLHLTGGASLSSFMANNTKHVVFPSLFPLKYFTIGRKYQPVMFKEHSLLNVTQETAVDIFIATLDNVDEMNRMFHEILNHTIEMYKLLNVHFRVTYVPAKELRTWESLRASIQLYSCFIKNYVEVGYISICDDYVSKRLLFNYKQDKTIEFPKVIHGSIFSVPKILACYLESNQDLKSPVTKEYII